MSSEKNVIQKRPNKWEILAFSIYAIVSGLAKYLTFPSCNPSYSSVLPIFIGIVSFGVVWGIISFFFPNFPTYTINKIGKAVVTGLGVGIGIVTVFVLITRSCF